MFPMMIHDWVAVLERIGYRIDYSTGSKINLDVVIVRNAKPLDIFHTLSLTQDIYRRRWGEYPSLVAVLTAEGLVHLDVLPVRGATVNDTRIYIPDFPESHKESDRLQWKAKKFAKSCQTA